MTERDETKKEETQKNINTLWKKGIPDLEISEIEKEKLIEIFSTWSSGFNLKLLTLGINEIIKDYKNLIQSLETSSCEHNGKINHGLDFQNCCGISYEYLNDLSCRTALEKINTVVNFTNFNNIENTLKKLDERFKIIPKDDEWIINQKLVDEYKQNGFWWYYGLPLNVKK